MMKFILILIASAFLGFVEQSDQVKRESIAERPCREHPQLVDRCFSFRGRMSYFNGTPSVRIWRVGTNRILGVSEGRFALQGDSNLPASIEAQLEIDSKVLFGDFTVCPFTPDEPGVMRLVCVESAANVSVRVYKRSEP